MNDSVDAWKRKYCLTSDTASNTVFGRDIDELINGIQEESKAINEAELMATVIDSVIYHLYSSRWNGQLAGATIGDMRNQLYKTLTDQVNGYWSGHSAYQIAVDGGFLIDSKRKRIEGINRCEGKTLTMFGEMFMKLMEKGQ
ncbi:coil containing protein [Vibrio phage 1.052.A._10N.286.46.C3]|nr:coil containing protein [Vibrio phage 1.052.A._10N.286.46.C3]